MIIIGNEYICKQNEEIFYFTYIIFAQHIIEDYIAYTIANFILKSYYLVPISITNSAIT